ncbi:hypothetical protein KUTeg_010236, partial [Tegillarca granosa]
MFKMDLDSENVEENEKYSFLLGSAIRNEDPDQFLSIYDAIIPKTLTDKQHVKDRGPIALTSIKCNIDYIKDKARGIADLPDEDFNQLVLNARDYSLAKGREKMSLGSGGSSRLRHNDDDKSSSNSSDEEEITPQRSTIIPPNLPFFPDSDHCIVDIEQVEKRTDNDSGIYNSSKATTSVGSYSDHDDSEGDDRGCFDYFPSQVRIGQPCNRYNLKYDEVHEVESDKNSQNDIESPRSDNSLGKDSDTDVYRGIHMDGTEMQTFSIRNLNNESDDFQTEDESEDDDIRINAHQRLYRGASSNYYSPMQLESTEDYNGGTYGSSTFSFDSSKKALQDRSASSLRGLDDRNASSSRGVDDSINFPIYSRHQNFRQNYGSTSSDSVHVEKSVFPRDSPPFGHTYQLENVGSSIGSLISSKKNQSVTNMPEGRHLTNDLDDKGKKKDYSTLDENGNPTLRPFLTDKSCEAYKQMREPPRSTHGGAIVSSSKNRSTASHYESPFPSNFHHFNHYTVSGQQVKDLEEDIPTQANQDRKRKKTKKEKVILSQDIDNYVGDKKQIDELVDFIENDGTKKSKKLNSINNTDNNVISTNAKTTDNKNKKNKEKKQVTINTTSKVIDNKYNIGEIIPEKELAEKEKVVPTQVGAPEISSVDKKEQEGESVGNSGVDSMGNSQGRNSENDEKSSYSSEELKMENNTKLNLNDKILTNAIEDLADFENSKNMQVEEKCVEDFSSLAEKNSEEIEKNCSSESKPAVVVESSANGGNNNNKKSKGKTSNNNKIETKVVGATTNNIKQNNMKNTRSKDHGNAKINTANCVSPTVSVNEEGEHFVPNAFYIFTDIDSTQSVEDEFTEVRKKKKRPVSLAPPPHVREFVKEQVNHKPPVLKEEQRVKPPVRSVTPPPYHNFTTIETTQDEQRVRDLSPSAFPALDRGNQKKGSFRDGRRNSTGDVPTEVLLKVQDDSDLESVKSLPASQGGCANQSTSPKLPISYAKMAASPKPSGTSIASVKTDDGTESRDSNSTNVMATVWKGTPTERRHSIGSSPENSKENSQTPVTVRQKCGSQENIKIVDENTMACIPSNSENVENETFKITKSKSVTEYIPNLDCSSLSTIQHPDPSSYIKTSTSKDNLSNESVDDLKLNHATVKAKTKTSNGPKNNVSVATVKQTNDADCITIRKDNNEGMTDSSHQMISSSSSDDVGGLNTSSCPLSPPSSSQAVIDKCVNSTTSSSMTSIKDNASEPIINSELLKDSKDTTKNKHKLAGKNGIVSTFSHLSYNSEHNPVTSESSSTTITFEGSDSSAAIKISTSESDANKGDNNINKSDHIRVCYGELPPLSSSSSDFHSERQPLKHLKFLRESGNNHFGIFNYTDAVNFLNKEWNNHFCILFACLYLWLNN